MERIWLNAILRFVAVNVLQVIHEAGSISVPVNRLAGIVDVGILDDHHGRRFQHIDTEESNRKSQHEWEESQILKYHFPRKP